MGNALSRRAAVIAIFTALGCGTVSDDSAVVIRDSSGVAIVFSDVSDTTAWPDCGVAAEPFLRVGGSGGGPAYELYQVEDAKRLGDGRVAVLNRGSREIRVFDATGTHQFSMGRNGDGPGEFRDPIELASLPPDSLAVWDWELGRVAIFTPDGAFVRNIRLDPSVVNPTGRVGTFSDGPPFVIAQQDMRTPTGTEFVTQYMQLLRYRRDGTLHDTIATLPYGQLGWVDRETSFVSRPVFQARGTFAVGGQDFYVADGADPEVQVWSSDLVLRRILRWRAPDRTVGRDEVDAYRRGALAGAGDDAVRQSIQRRLDAVPVAKVFPAVRDLKVDPLGRVWTQRYPRPSVERQIWFRFDLNGAFSCAAAFSGDIDVMQFGEDYMLGTTTDDVDVESVVLFAVRQ